MSDYVYLKEGNAMREILEMANNDILITDDIGNILYANTSFLQANPKLESHITEKNIRDIFFIVDKNIDIMAFIKQNLHTKCRMYYIDDEFPVDMRIIKHIWDGQIAYLYFMQKESKPISEDSRIFLDQLLYSVWRKDIEGRYCYANKAFMKQLAEETAYDTSESIIGKRDEEIWDPIMTSILKKAEEEVLKIKGSYSFEKEVERKSGKRWYRFKISPILDDNGEVKYTCGICEENTIFRHVVSAVQKEYDKEYDKGYEGVTEKICLREIEDIKEQVRGKLHADGMYIGILKGDKFHFISKAGTAIKDFEDLDALTNMQEWMRFMDGKWGIVEAKDLAQFNGKGYKRGIVRQYKYYFYQPLVFGKKVIGLLSASYLNEKPDLSNQMLWLPKFCESLAILIKNKMVGSLIQNSIAKQHVKEHELHSIIQTATDITVMMDKDGIISKVNYCWEKELGWKQEEMIGKKLKQFFYIEDRLKMISEIKSCHMGKRSGSVRILRNDATLQWYGWQMNYEAEMDCIIFTAVNITHLLEEARMEEQEKDAREMESFRDDFLTNIGHEFRTPVNVILSAIQLLRIMQEQTGGLQQADFVKYFDKIKHNSYRLLRLTNNLIALSKLDINNVELNLVNINIVGMIENIVRGVRSCTDKKKVEIRFVTNVSQDMLACDISKMEKAVLNLISNSIKYAKANEKAIIEVSVIGGYDEVCIGVKDNGIGICKEKIPIIFEPFVQGSTILNRPAEGSGVGLALVKGYVKLHHGRIEVESEEGIGSQFTIHLPITTMNQIEVKQGDYRSIVEKCRIELSDIPS